MRWAVVAFMVLGFAVSVSPARADWSDAGAGGTHQVESPERFNLELRFSPYKPDVGNRSFDDTFGGDIGPLLAAEFDVFIFRIPYVGHFGVGAGFGWSHYTGRARDSAGAQTSEETTLTLLPATLVALVRVDALPRNFGIPFVFTGKLGGDAVIWSTGTGKSSDASGVSLGLRLGFQAALELDIFDRSAARMLDEEWGINHASIFFELYKSFAGSQGNSLPVGDFTWALGLGFTF